MIRPERIKIEIDTKEDNLEMQTARAQAYRVFSKIKQWRLNNQAPVDKMGAQEHSDKSLPQNEQAFQYLVGVLLSVQSRDEFTDKIMKELLKDGISIDKYYKLSEEEIYEKIKSINHNKKKAFYIKNAALRIKDQLGGKVPDTLEEITKFKGVGAKVGNIVLQQAFQKSFGVAVDVHVHRISNRIGWCNTKDPNKTMESLNHLFEDKDYKEVNHQIVGLGQLICKAKNPKCIDCPISLDCEYGIKNLKEIQNTSTRGKRVRRALKKED